MVEMSHEIRKGMKEKDLRQMNAETFFFTVELQFIAVSLGIFPECIHAIQTICDDKTSQKKKGTNFSSLGRVR